MKDGTTTVAIVGLGEVGQAVMASMVDSTAANLMKFKGVDVDHAKISVCEAHGVPFVREVPQADVYIVCVWTAEQICQVLEKIKEVRWRAFKEPMLISIESTIDPESLMQVKLAAEGDLWDKVVAFPHRFNPNDPEHQIFNLDRVLGGLSEKGTQAALQFFEPFFKIEGGRIAITDFETAALSKVLENAYRFVEIVVAQELATAFKEKGYDFERVRSAANTKWNIDILQALKGVGGKCLPKDMAFLNKALKHFTLGELCVYLNEQYKKANAGL